MGKFINAAATSHALSLAAMEEASREGVRVADIEHLLLALTLDAGTAGQVLRGAGVTLETTRQAISAQHADQLGLLGVTTEPDPPGPAVFQATGGYDWTERAAMVLKDAATAGRKGDAPAVLRVLLSEPSGFIEAALHRMGISPAALVGRLDEVDHLSAKTEPPARTDALSRTSTAFVPAPLEQVWALVSDPVRLPEWDSALQSVVVAPDGAWIGRAQSHRPDGKSLKVDPSLRRLRIEYTTEPDTVTWRFSYPDSPRANVRTVTLALEPAAAGTQLRISLAWQPSSAQGRRRLRRLVLAPAYRVILWIQANQLGLAVGRALRDQ